MQFFWHDTRYAVRTLIKMPGFALAAILTLALAIGANTAFFSVINGILLEPLPYPDSERLVVIANLYGSNRTSNSVPDYLDRVRDGTTLESVAAFKPQDFSLTSESATAHLSGALVTASFFDVLGVRAAMGRAFTPEEDQPGANDVVILSDATWQQYFQADPAIVGKRITLDGRPHTVVGVMPHRFRMPLQTGEIWRPIAFTPAQLAPNSRGNEFLTNIARFKSGASLEQVLAEMQTLAARAVDNGGTRQQFLINAKFSATVELLTEETVGAVRRPLLVLLGATGLILLIALANVANLLLARASARRREIFIRSTLGAQRSRIVVQMMTESLLLSLLGGVVGLAFAYWGVRLLVSLRLDGIPRLSDIGVDYRVVGFAIALSVITGIVFGILPAWTMSRSTYGVAKAGVRGAGSSGKGFRQGVVVLQVAVAMILLVGAGLLIGSIQRLMAVNPGFKTENRIAFRVSLPSTIYPNAESKVAFFNRLIERLSSLPGVQSAGISTLSPFDVRNDTATFHVEGFEELPGAKPLGSELREISGGYPSAIGMPILLGRTFDERDRVGSPYVVLVDQRTADRFWPGESPLGKRLRFGTAWREVVGVAGTVKNQRLDADGEYQIYIPFLQFPEPNMIVAVHADADPSTMIRAAREAVAELDRNVPVFDVRTLEQRVNESLALRRYSMMLLGGFGVAGLLVSLIGIYGVIAYSVRQRTQEIGIRLALGAQRHQVLRMVVGQGVVLAGAGIVVGTAGAFWLTRFLESMLYGVSATDPKTFFLVAASLMSAACLASYVPAEHASRLDPLGALKGD